MKVNVRIVVLLLACIGLYAEAGPGNPPSEEQVGKLVAAAWKEPVRSIDVTLYKEITKPPKSVEEFRRIFENSFDKREGPKENLSAAELEMRNRNIQLNVERAIKEQEAGRRMKQRIRIDGHRQCLDQVIGWPKMVLLEGTPEERTRPDVILGPNTPYEATFVNFGDQPQGDFTSFVYYHKMKSATITNKRGARWKRSDVPKFAAFPIDLQSILGQKQDTSTGVGYEPDTGKLDRLASTGELDNMSVRICPEPNDPNARDRIEVKFCKDCVEPGIIIVCDREDYSRVYYCETRNASNKPFLIRECSNFDAQGFPRTASIIEYDFEGSLKKKEVYTFEKVELNPLIPDEVFKFNPPPSYKVEDLRSKKP